MLRAAAAQKMARLYSHPVGRQTEITITAGAIRAFITAFLALVHAVDEIIVLNPCLRSYKRKIVLAGGVAVPVTLEPGTFRPEFVRIAAALNQRYRGIKVQTRFVSNRVVIQPVSSVAQRRQLLSMRRLQRHPRRFRGRVLSRAT